MVEIEARIAYLKKTAQTDRVKFLTDHYIATSAERDLEVAIQGCLDIADHIATKLALGLPKKDRKEIFQILADHTIISPMLTQKLTAMAGMRNILIHEYLEVEREKVYQTITEDLGDIVLFLKEIQRFLDTKNTSY